MSRPSRIRCMCTDLIPAASAAEASASACRSCPCTPPGPRRVMRCRWFPRAACRAAVRFGIVANVPSAIAASIRGRSCGTCWPDPMLRWPTSLLPIWPTGRPTAGPLAFKRACGHDSLSPLQADIRAAATASLGSPAPMPNPSTTRMTAVGGTPTLSAAWHCCGADDI